MHTAWDEAAETAIKQGIQMVKIECGSASDPEHAKLSDEYKIRGFPTILVLKDGSQVNEYQGPRTSSAFLSYASEQLN
jgi:thioredoxin-like negative regulator of GroEL